jgi:hypothetical protein
MPWLEIVISNSKCYLAVGEEKTDIKNSVLRVGSKCLDLFLSFAPFRHYVNTHADLALFFKDVPGCCLWYDGLKYTLCRTSNLDVISQVAHDYLFDDIKDTDVVLDIGAHIGAFSLPASRKAKQVYALEPLFCNLLRANIELNGIKNRFFLKLSG